MIGKRFVRARGGGPFGFRDEVSAKAHVGAWLEQGRGGAAAGRAGRHYLGTPTPWPLPQTLAPSGYCHYARLTQSTSPPPDESA